MARKQRYQWQDGAPTEQEEGLSRSEMKRRSTALQKMGEELAALPLSALEDMPLTADLREELAMLKRITDREGRRRQMQFIGRLMREQDAPAIREALDALAAGHKAGTALFHRAEQWRHRLLTEDAGQLAALFTAFGQSCPGLAAPQLQKLEELTQDARRENGAPHAQRALFRHIMGCLQAAASGQ